MTELALRCAGCGAALRVPHDVRSLACQRCGEALAIERGGGAVYAVVDRGLERPGAPTRAAEPLAPRRPTRTSSIAGGAAAAIAGIAFTALTLGAGSWAWAAAGALVAVTGLAAAVRALASDAHSRSD